MSAATAALVSYQQRAEFIRISFAWRVFISVQSAIRRFAITADDRALVQGWKIVGVREPVYYMQGMPFHISYNIKHEYYFELVSNYCDLSSND